MRSGACFALPRPERLTVASGSSCWATPAASLTNDGEEPGTFLARQERLRAKGINGNGAGMPLTVEAKLWPTASARDGDPRRAPTRPDSEAWRRKVERGAVNAAGLLSDDLSSSAVAVVQRWNNWPTPAARDGRDGRASPETMARNSRPLNEVAVMLWPTATATDAKASGAAGYSTAGGRHAGVTLTDAAVRGLLAPTTPMDGSSTSVAGRALNPPFVEMLLGWPLGSTCLCGKW